MGEEDRTQHRLLEAAGLLFAAVGFDRANVREITKSADASPAAVNYHFRSKEELYIETVRQAARDLERFSPIPTFPPGTPAEARLRGFIHSFLKRILDRDGPQWQRDLVLREVNEPRPGACEEFVRQFVRPNFEALLGIVRELVPAGLPFETLGMLAGSVIGQMLHYHHCRHVIGFLVGPEVQKAHTIEALTDHVHRFSLAALRGYAAGGA